MPEESTAQTGQTGQTAEAPTQQGAGAGADAPTTPAEDMISKAEFEKVVGQRQSAKERARTLEKQLAELQGKVEAMPDADALTKFNEWQSQQEQATRTKAIEAGDVDALERKIREPLEKQIGAKDQAIDTLSSQLKNILCDQALRRAAEQANAVNPDQIVGLLRHRVKMTTGADGSHVPEFIDDDGSAMFDANGRRMASAEDFVSAYLGLPQNANLVKTSANPGSGAKPPGGKAGQTINPDTITLEEYNALPEEQKPDVAMRMSPARRKTVMGLQTTPQHGSFV